MADQEASSGTSSIEVPNRQPGELIGVEVSYKEVLQLSEEEKTALKELCRTVQNRDMAARREEVIRVWEKRLFDRGFQHLLPLWGGGWKLPSANSNYSNNNQDSNNSRSIFETNIYNSYGQIIISALTREVPTVRFKPRQSDNDADITAANSAEKLKVGIERNNRMISVMADIARFQWTDGRTVLFTKYVKDGQQFGYEEPQDALEEETVPEDEEAIGAAESEGMGASGSRPDMVPQGDGNDEALGSTSSQSEGIPEGTGGTPRGREVICAYGALESKLPIKADNLSQCPYAQISTEIDQQVAKAKYPDAAKNIKPQQGGPGSDDIDRLARINTRLGVLENYLTSDSAVYDVTEQITWFRPAALLEIKKEEERNSLMKKAGRDGVRVIFCGEQFCEARSLSMDDQLSLIHALPGDGMHRPGLGDWLVPIQKVLNNWEELSDEYFIHGVPATWADNEMFSVEALADQTSIPGQTHGFDREPGVTKDEVWWQEEAIQYPEELWNFIQDFKGPLAQLLCGAMDAMFAGDAAPNDASGIALGIKRDLALGRLGIPWRFTKEGICTTMRQAVQCLAHNHQGAIEVDLGKESVKIEMDDLKGEFLVFPESDENFPETYTQRANRLALVVQDASTNPLYQQLLDSPDNVELLLDGIGLEEMRSPIVEARDKQLGENAVLLNSGPTPNPAFQQLQKILLQLQQQAQMVNPQDVQASQKIAMQLQQVQQTLQTTPEQISSVQVRYFDDHATELQTCIQTLNSEECRRMYNGTPDEQAEVLNLELHAKEHEAEVKKKQAEAPPVGAKPPSMSMNIKDLPPNVAAQEAAKAGLKATPQDFAAQQAADAVEKHPAGGISIQ